MKDRTFVAVKNQMDAMGCSNFEVGIYNSEDQIMLNKQYDKNTLLKSINYLKSENRRGNDIYIRPAKNEKHGLVLVDDIDEVTVDEMKSNGHSPACTVETSHKNLQAWVKCGSDIESPQRKYIARILAEEYGADSNSADARHYGRLAGFTNRKPEHLTPKGPPFCLLKGKSGKQAENASELIKSAKELLKNEKQLSNECSKLLSSMPDGTKDAQLKSWYEEYYLALRDIFEPNFDRSRADWMFAVKAFESNYSKESIEEALSDSDIRGDNKTEHRRQNYIQNTVIKAGVFVELAKKTGKDYAELKEEVSKKAASIMKKGEAEDE